MPGASPIPHRRKYAKLEVCTGSAVEYAYSTRAGPRLSEGWSPLLGTACWLPVPSTDPRVDRLLKARETEVWLPGWEGVADDCDRCRLVPSVTKLEVDCLPSPTRDSTTTAQTPATTTRRAGLLRYGCARVGRPSRTINVADHAL